jgi:DNA uptake protein ComE-like DNA-binding protein
MLSLSDASFDELRDIGLSVTQAKRVIRYREENNGFTDVSELDRVPGFPKAFLTRLKDDVVP